MDDNEPIHAVMIRAIDGRRYRMPYWNGITYVLVELANRTGASDRQAAAALNVATGGKLAGTPAIDAASPIDD